YSEMLIQSVRISLIFIAVFYGLTMVVVAQVFSYIVGFVVYQYFLKQHVSISVGEVLRASAKSFPVTVFAILGPCFVIALWGLRPPNIFLSLGTACATFAVGWLAGLFAVRHPLTREIKLASVAVVAKMRW
ncbi:MAG: hypothetical protein WD470_12025, partial [Rhodospirillaceae bacterium]